MLMYLDHLQNSLDNRCDLLIFLILALFGLSETGQILGFRAFSGECMEGMAWKFACWCILNTFRIESFMVMVCWYFNFWRYFDLWNASNFGFPGISWRMHGGNGLKFCMLLYLGDLHNWLDYGHGLVIFQILALFLLSETGLIFFFAISQEIHGGNGLKILMLIYPDHLQNWLD